MFSFLKAVKSECKNFSWKNSLENECESPCSETNEMFCLDDISLMMNSYANSDKICLVLINSVNNLNELDSLKCARRILLNYVTFKSRI